MLFVRFSISDADRFFMAAIFPFLPDAIMQKLLRPFPNQSMRFRDIFRDAWSKSLNSLVCCNTRSW